LPNAAVHPRRLPLLGAAAVHVALIALLVSTGASRHLEQIARPIAARLIELAPPAALREPPPANPSPPPRRPPPARAAEVPPVAAAIVPAPATAFAVPHAGDSIPPAAAAAPRAPATANAAPAEQPVTAVRFDAAYLANPKPPYPPASRRLGEEGRVVLRVRVGADGLAEHVELRQSSGFARLDAAAADAVARWRFVPATRGAQAMAAWVLVPVVFNLES
jgi:protein TonB